MIDSKKKLFILYKYQLKKIVGNNSARGVLYDDILEQAQNDKP